MFKRISKLRREKKEAEQVLFELGDNPDADDPEVAEANAAIKGYREYINEAAKAVVLVLFVVGGGYHMSSKANKGDNKDAVTHPTTAVEAPAAPVTPPPPAKENLTSGEIEKKLRNNIITWMESIFKIQEKQGIENALSRMLYKYMQDEEATPISFVKERYAERKEEEAWLDRHGIEYVVKKPVQSGSTEKKSHIFDPLTGQRGFSEDLMVLTGSTQWMTMAQVVEDNTDEEIDKNELFELVTNTSWHKRALIMLDKFEKNKPAEFGFGAKKREVVELISLVVVRGIGERYDSSNIRIVEACAYILCKSLMLRPEKYQAMFGDLWVHIVDMAEKPQETVIDFRNLGKVTGVAFK